MPSWGLATIKLTLEYFQTPVKPSVLLAQSCPTLCDTLDCSLPDSSAYGILQARILEWVAIPFSRGSFWPSDQTLVSCIAGRFLPSEPAGKPNET